MCASGELGMQKEFWPKGTENIWMKYKCVCVGVMYKNIDGV